jgi:DNA-binding transcriptional regulator GbsR (MarR family)
LFANQTLIKNLHVLKYRLVLQIFLVFSFLNKKNQLFLLQIKRMEDSERIVKQRELVEYIGRSSEKDGIQPVAARIMGLLMVMDKEEYTFDEIVMEMKISKGAVSTALKNLELRGIIEYITYHNDRKRYFRFISKDINTIIGEAEKKIRQQIDIIDRIVSLKKDQGSKNVRLLKSISKGLKFFILKMGELKNNI